MAGKALVKMGRPPFPWTPELKDQIIELLICGVTLVEISKMEGMPSYPTIYYERQADPDFSIRLLRAREEGAHALADECVVIANTPEEGDTITRTPDGTTWKTEDMLGHRRLKIDTRLRLIGKWNALYGEKKALEVSAPGGGPVRHITTEMTAKEAAEAWADTLREEEG